MEQSPNTCSVWYIRLFTVWSQFFLPASFLALPHTPKFLPTQMMCSFPNMPHSNSPLPLAIFSAHLGNSCIVFIVSSVKPCLVSLLSFSSPTELVAPAPCFHSAVLTSVSYHFYFCYVLLFIVYTSVIP